MTTQSKRTVAFALCGSFCSFAAVLPQLRVLTARGWDVLPVLSASAAGLDTRFGTASALRQTLYEVTGHRRPCRPLSRSARSTLPRRSSSPRPPAPRWRCWPQASARPP